eukprot:SAG11_NODE_8710_length_985_cov_0.955982_3_plen_175_part_00
MQHTRNKLADPPRCQARAAEPRDPLDYRLDYWTLMAAALGPVLLWHATPTRRFDWFGFGEEFIGRCRSRDYPPIKLERVIARSRAPRCGFTNCSSLWYSAAPAFVSAAAHRRLRGGGGHVDWAPVLLRLAAKAYVHIIGLSIFDCPTDLSVVVPRAFLPLQSTLIIICDCTQVR